MSILKKIDRRFKNTEMYHNFLKKKFEKKDPRFSTVKLTPRAEEWYQELSQNGIVRIENVFAWCKDIYERNYFSGTQNQFFLKDLVDDRSQKTGRVFAKSVSIKDPLLENWYFNQELFSMLAKMFQRQPYYRNQPMVQTYTFQKNHQMDIAGKWHIDGGLNQITFMLLINDITEEDTHMEFALKSTHKIHTIRNRNKISDAEIESEFEIMKCIGKGGTLYVFQGGMGYHRAVYKENSSRSVYHSNFTSGHDLHNSGLEKRFGMPIFENDTPFYIGNLYQKIVS